MDSKDYGLVKEEITLVISELNNKEILSNQDKIEIEDHFYCDVEDLVGSGLSTREALLVARSRFGPLDSIREDYEVVKPEENLLYYVFIGVLLFSFMKGLFVAINMIAQVFWIGIYIYNSTFIENNFWMDIPLRFTLLGIGLLVSFWLFKRNPTVNFNRFWYVPILYFVLEVMHRTMGFIVLPGINPYEPVNALRTYGVMMQNESFVGIVLILLISLVVSFKLFRLKREEYRYV